MAESQDAGAVTVVEVHDENSLSLGAKKIGTVRPRKTKDQAAAERADQLAVLHKTDTAGWSEKKLASHTIALEKLTEKRHLVTRKRCQYLQNSIENIQKKC